MSLVPAVTVGLLGSIVPGALLTMLGVGVACAFHHCPLRVRDDASEGSIPILFQFNNTDLRGRDLAQLRGLNVNITDMTAGEAMFGSDFFADVKGHWFETDVDEAVCAYAVLISAF